MTPAIRYLDMKIGILETGLIREELADDYAPYPVMFERLLNHAGSDLECVAYSPVRGEMPKSVYDCDGWLITGSRHGVYEQLDWMLTLQAFIREVAAAGIPMIGVCFGHQIMAEAMGGKVVKSDLGWKVGLKHYDVDQSYDWMVDQSDSIGIHAWHQDQVVELPPTAEVFLSAEDCPYAGLSYAGTMMSVQAHPEIERDYERALLDMFGGKLVPDDVTREAKSTLEGEEYPDTHVLARWFAEFFLSRQAAVKSAGLQQAQS